MDTDFQRKLSSLRLDRGDERASRGRGAWIAILALLVVAAAVAGWLWLRPRTELVRTVLVEEASVSAGGSATVLNASGYVTPRRQATVSSKITGKVVEVLVEEGLQVEEGQILARLDDSQARLGLELARASLAAARISLMETEVRIREARLRRDRTRQLLDAGFASPADWDAVEAEVDGALARLDAQRAQARVAEREVDLALQNLDDTVIRAPFAGVAITKNAQPGEIISPMSAGGGFTRTGISTIVDMASLEIEVDVNEAYIQRVTPGQRVLATLDAYPDWQIPSSVITTIPAADRQKATVTVRIAFDELDPRILPDLGIKVAFLSEPVAEGSAKRRVVRVPRAAIRGVKGGEYVLVVDADERLERRAIRLGLGGRDPAEIEAGLRPGERVVIEGGPELAAGVAVREEPR